MKRLIIASIFVTTACLLFLFGWEAAVNPAKGPYQFSKEIPIGGGAKFEALKTSEITQTWPSFSEKDSRSIERRRRIQYKYIPLMQILLQNFRP